MKTAIHHRQHVVSVFNCLCNITYTPKFHQSTVHTSEDILPNCCLKEKINEQQDTEVSYSCR